MRIALVEPSRTIRRIVTGMVEPWGYSVCPYADADEALSCLQADPAVRVLITSVELASTSGFQLAARARAMVGNHRPLYIILMSSTDEYNKCVQALDNGADDFIGKPPIPEELRARLRVADRVTAMQGELVKLATTDPLTGLLTRRAFFDRAQTAIARAQLGQALSAVMLDLDHFKRINDTHGHEGGDIVLKRVAEELSFLPTITARLGGEEFVFLLDTPFDESLAIADAFRRSVQDLAIFAGDRRIPVTCSMGIAEWEPADTIDTLLRRADIALYEAKRSGRNCIVVADSFAVSAEHKKWRGAARVVNRDPIPSD